MAAVLPFVFLSTPSARRATCIPTYISSFCSYFYPRPPRGGRPQTKLDIAKQAHFYPRPPRGGRRAITDEVLDAVIISIHALREEGDG